MNKKERIYIKQSGKCNICDIDLNILGMEMDHVQAKSHGGLLIEDNCQLLCKYCNRTKSNMQNDIFEELMKYLKYEFISRNDIRYIRKHILSSKWDCKTLSTYFFNQNKHKLDNAIKEGYKDVYLIFNK